MGSKEPDYRPRLGFFIYKLGTIATIGGFIFGYDTSILSPAVIYLQNNRVMEPWTDTWTDAIFSANLGMAAVGALVAGVMADVFGRRKTIMLSDAFNITGAITCSVAFDKWMLLVGVVFLGLATGMASHTSPLYISESCPSYLRGRFVTSFQLTITIGIMTAYAVAGAFSYVSPVYVGWRLMFAFAILPSIAQLIGMWSLPQSPRYAFEKDGIETCEKIFEQIYDHNEEWIQYEIFELRAAHERGEQNRALHQGSNVVYRVFGTPHVLKAVLIGCALQIFQQTSGVNTIEYFINNLFKAAGIEGDNDSLWLAVGPSAIHFMCTFIPMYLVEIKGRRMLLIASVAGCVLSLFFMAGTFLMMNKTSAIVTHINGQHNNTWANSSAPNFNVCNLYRNCDFCVTDSNCGFCSLIGEQSIQGYCLPVNPINKNAKSETGFCSTNPNSDDNYHHVSVKNGLVSLDRKYEWEIDYCHTDYAVIPIVVATIYLCCYSIGLAPLPWVLNSEFYPFWARATCMAFSTFTNWIFNMIISLSYLSLSLAFTRYGLFFVFNGITLISLVFYIFMIPETKDVSVANVELLFMSEEERRELHIEKSQDPRDVNYLTETWERVKKF